MAIAFLLGLAPLSAHSAPESGAIVVVAPINARGTPLTSEQIEKLTTLLEGKTAFRVVPRSAVRDWITSQKADSYRECFDEACQIELGKALAAQKTLVSEWASIGSACVLTTRLIDLRTEVAEFPAQATAPCTEVGLAAAIDEVASRLRAQLDPAIGTFQLDLEDAKKVKNPPTDRKGYLVIAAEAQGSPEERIDVYINGELKGQVVGGVFMALLDAGKYIVLLKTAGDRYSHKRQLIELGTENVRFPKDGKYILPKVSGTVEFVGSPADIVLSIDGRPRRVRAPYVEELRVGHYSFVVECPGYLPFGPKDISLEAGQRLSLAYTLARNAGSLTIKGSPLGARVMLDGSPAGTLPLTLPDVDVGGHRLRVDAPGYYSEEQLVQVSRGEHPGVDVALKEKVARLSLEAIAKVPDGDSPVEAQLYIDGVERGMTPWKGEVRAEMSHTIELRLAQAVGPRASLTLPEGSDHREVVVVPSAWGGATSRLRLELVAGPWEARVGDTRLDLVKPNDVRPGHVDVDLYLEGRRLAIARVDITPAQDALVVVSGRPRTVAELETSYSAWAWRKWISLGVAFAAGVVSGEQLALANHAASQRSAAYQGFLRATSGAELDGYRASISSLDDTRRTSQVVSSVGMVVAGAFGAWALVEWLFGEPSIGKVVGPGIVAVEQ